VIPLFDIVVDPAMPPNAAALVGNSIHASPRWLRALNAWLPFQSAVRVPRKAKKRLARLCRGIVFFPIEPAPPKLFPVVHYLFDWRAF
jgi:hypothetical protein